MEAKHLKTTQAFVKYDDASFLLHKLLSFGAFITK